jgi:hypothetical protein
MVYYLNILPAANKQLRPMLQTTWIACAILKSTALALAARRYVKCSKMGNKSDVFQDCQRNKL